MLKHCHQKRKYKHLRYLTLYTERNPHENNTHDANMHGKIVSWRKGFEAGYVDKVKSEYKLVIHQLRLVEKS
jgi:hypothetical protein